MIRTERAFLEDYKGLRLAMVLHEFDGILQPLDIRELMERLREKLKHIRAQNGDFIIGLDDFGKVPAIALSLLTNLPVIFATKANLARSPKLRFDEPLSQRPHVYLYGLRLGMSVILVDDAVNTGKTLASCIKCLHQQGVHIRAVVTLLESTRHGARDLIRHLGYELISLEAHDLSSL